MENNTTDGKSRTFNLLNLGEKRLNDLLIIGIAISLVTIVALLIIFAWHQPFTIAKEYVINHELLGTYGDFFGGVIGTFFAILAALLMFSTLKSQRELTAESNRVQKEISDAAIESQENLAAIQSKEASLQRFNSLFFELLSLFRSQRNELNISISKDGTPKNYFDTKMKELYDSFEPSSSYGKTANKAARNYLKLYLKHASELAPVFRSLYRLMDLIDNAKIDQDEKRQYAKIVRAQLGEGELFLLRYNATTEYGKKFIRYITKYNLLKHLPAMSLLEFKKYRNLMDTDEDKRSVAINMHIQKLRKAMYKRTIYRNDYDDVANVRIYKHSKYEVCIDMSDPTCTILKIYEAINVQNKGSIFKVFLQFTPDDMKGFMTYILKEIYDGSNFYIFNTRENSESKCNVSLQSIDKNIQLYQAKFYIQTQGGVKKELRMSHPDWDS